MQVVAPNSGDGTSAASEEEAKLCPPSIERPDVDMTSCSSTASDESWARGIFGKRRHPADTTKGGNWKTACPPSIATGAVAGAAAAPAAAPATAPPELGAASGFAGAFGDSVGNGHHPRDTGVEFGFGPSAGLAGSATDGGISSNSAGPVSAGDAAAVTAAASTAAAQDGNRSLDQQDRQGEEVALFPLLSSAPSAQTGNAAPGPAEMDGNGNGNGGLELLHASELEGAEAAGFFDALDELLGDVVLEGFGEGGGEKGTPPFV